MSSEAQSPAPQAPQVTRASEKAVIIRTLGLEKSYGSGEAMTHALSGVDSTIVRARVPPLSKDWLHFSKL
jgi:hypothetical protein